MTDGLSLRLARTDDIGALDRLFQRSYTRLLAPDYPPSVLVTAVPVIGRAQADLVASGRFYIVEDLDGHLLGAGGWSLAAPGGRPAQAGIGHVRHVATDPDAVRRGVGRVILSRIIQEARAEGVTALHCVSTRTARRFYESMGFAAAGQITLRLRGVIDFPAVAMTLDL